MENIKSFSIFKSKLSDNPKAPSHNISANVGTTETPEYINIGACWTKEGKSGKFLSCKLQDAYKDHTTQDNTKSRVGFAVVEEKATPKTKQQVQEEMPPEDDGLDAF